MSARAQRILFFAWCAFVVYGSFIPFHFDTNVVAARVRLTQIPLYPYQAGMRNFSRLDLISNVLLFVPFGFLLAGRGFWRRDRGWVLRIATTVALAALLAASIETGQLFSPGRTSSAIDVEAEAAGALLGAYLAYLFGRLEARVEARIRWTHGEPLVVAIALMALWLASDAFYPFAVTLDVSTVWHNVKQARWIPFLGSRRFWLDRVVDHAVMFGMLAALGALAFRRRVPAARAATMAMGACVVLSVGLEIGTLFFVDRSPDIENVILASMGSVVGATVVPTLAAWKPVARHAKVLLTIFALALLAYWELTPFAFDASSPALTPQIRRIEWMPFSSYYGADAYSALFDLWRKLALAGFWGFAFSRVRGGSPLAAALSGLVVGAVLEALQVFLRSRVPSVTDVLILAAGAWIGGAVCRYYRRAVAESAGP